MMTLEGLQIAKESLTTQIDRRKRDIYKSLKAIENLDYDPNMNAALVIEEMKDIQAVAGKILEMAYLWRELEAKVEVVDAIVNGN